MNSRAAWEKRNPPNHAGYYYCHICGGWVHRDQAELDEIVPKSTPMGQDPYRDDNRRMAHAFPQTKLNGEVYCIGNRGKGSMQVPSATLEIAPPDGE